MTEKSINMGLLTIFFGIFCFLYVPFIFGGGVIIDDWGMINTASHYVGFFETAKGYWTAFANRPLAPLVLSGTEWLFGTWTTGYILLNSCCWLLAIAVLATVFYKSFHSLSLVIVFFSLAIAPTIASTVIFSSGMQFLGTLSILLWAFSLFALYYYLVTNNNFWYYGSYLLVLLAFFIYEVFFPLLVFNMMLPVFFDPPSNRNTYKIYFKKYILPILGIMCCVLLLQKIILPYFTTVPVRLHYEGIKKILFALRAWINALLVTFPLLLVSVPLFLKDIPMIAFFLILANAFLYFKIKQHPLFTKDRQSSLIIRMAGYALGACSLIYLLNTAEATIGGYDNRGLASAWIAMSFLLAAFVNKYRQRSLTFLIFILVFLVQASFAIQVRHYVLSWQQQNAILSECIALSQPQLFNTNKMIIIGNVPKHVQPNFNNEEIFNTVVDFGSALNYFSHARITGMPINKEKIEGDQLKIVDNQLVMYDQSFLVDLTQSMDILWYYDYYTHTLTKIHTGNELRRYLESVRMQPAEEQTFSEQVRKRIREISKRQ